MRQRRPEYKSVDTGAVRIPCSSASLEALGVGTRKRARKFGGKMDSANPACPARMTKSRREKTASGVGASFKASSSLAFVDRVKIASNRAVDRPRGLGRNQRDEGANHEVFARATWTRMRRGRRISVGPDACKMQKDLQKEAILAQTSPSADWLTHCAATT